MKTKQILMAGVLALGCASLASAAAFVDGDVILGFRSSSSTSVLFYNVGASVGFRDNGSQGQVADLGSALSTTFGSGWFSDSNISWGAFANRNNADPTPPFGTPPAVVNGDPSATIYMSAPNAVAGGSTAWGTYTESQLVSASTRVRTVANFFKNNSGTNNLFVTTTSATTYDDEATKPADFGLFTGSMDGSLSQKLDLYRILANTTGASPTGTLGLGSYETTFSINSLGQVTAVDVTAAVIPEPSTYTALAGALALAGAVTRRRGRKA